MAYVRCENYYAPGSWLRAKGPVLDHHGIAGDAFVNEEQSVIHSDSGGVRLSTLSEFAAGRRIEVLWSPVFVEQQRAALWRAYSQVGRPYSLLFGNCEHFASWVVTGMPRSKQLSNYVYGLSFGAVLLWALASASGSSARRR